MLHETYFGTALIHIKALYIFFVLHAFCSLSSFLTKFLDRLLTFDSKNLYLMEFIFHELKRITWRRDFSRRCIPSESPLPLLPSNDFLQCWPWKQSLFGSLERLVCRLALKRLVVKAVCHFSWSLLILHLANLYRQEIKVSQ